MEVLNTEVDLTDEQGAGRAPDPRRRRLRARLLQIRPRQRGKRPAGHHPLGQGRPDGRRHRRHRRGQELPRAAHPPPLRRHRGPRADRRARRAGIHRRIAAQPGRHGAPEEHPLLGARSATTSNGATSTPPTRRSRRAAKAAQAHDFIMGFPNGYDTWIEQGGVNVSGGRSSGCASRAPCSKSRPSSSSTTRPAPSTPPPSAASATPSTPR